MKSKLSLVRTVAVTIILMGVFLIPPKSSQAAKETYRWYGWSFYYTCDKE
jgi:hypothetical protein